MKPLLSGLRSLRLLLEKGQIKPSPLALRQIEALARDLGPEVQDLLLEFFPEEANP